jgi:hypothetical protein
MLPTPSICLTVTQYEADSSESEYALCGVASVANSMTTRRAITQASRNVAPRFRAIGCASD